MIADTRHIIKERLNDFIRKYYLQKITQGLLGTFAISCGLWLSFTALAYLYFLSTEVRFILMVSLISVLCFFALKDVVRPLLKLLQIGKRISDEQAAQIIGVHFKGEIDDKLLNAIHLLNANNDSELILASIHQKTDKLKSYNFLHAIPIDQVKGFKNRFNPCSHIAATTNIKAFSNKYRNTSNCSLRYRVHP